MRSASAGVRWCSNSVKISVKFVNVGLVFLVQICNEVVILTPVLSPPEPLSNPNSWCSPPPLPWNNSLPVPHNQLI